MGLQSDASDQVRVTFHRCEEGTHCLGNSYRFQPSETQRSGLGEG